MVVGALIFVLGLDLVKEALWDTRNKVSRYEYLVILAIVVGMTVADFVLGLLGGIVLACTFFVVQSSKRSAIRGGQSHFRPSGLLRLFLLLLTRSLVSFG